MFQASRRDLSWPAYCCRVPVGGPNRSRFLMHQPWIDWATWDDRDINSPQPFDGSPRMRIWPSRLILDVESSGGSFEVQVAVYDTAGCIARQ